jgi:hypothetical protein
VKVLVIVEVYVDGRYVIVTVVVMIGFARVCTDVAYSGVHTLVDCHTQLLLGEVGELYDDGVP